MEKHITSTSNSNDSQDTAEPSSNAEWSVTSSALDNMSYPSSNSPINTDYGILDHQDTAELSSNAEWSATSSALVMSNPIDNSPMNTENLKELWANSMDLGEFMAVETSGKTSITNPNADDTGNLSICKPSAFHKKQKLCVNNDSVMFENALIDDSQMEVTQNSVCLNLFQKRKRLLPSNASNDDDYDEINNSNISGMDSVDVSVNSLKFCYKKKSNDQSCFNLPNESLSSTVVSDSDNVNDSELNKNEVFKKPLDSSTLENDCSNFMNAFKTKVSVRKLNTNCIKEVDTAFDNAINDWSMTSNTLSSKNESLNDISTANLQEISKCNIKGSTLKFNKKNMDLVDDTAFDNVINDLSKTSTITSPKNNSLNNISTENSQEISKCSTLFENKPSLNHTYDVSVNCHYSQLESSQCAKKNNKFNNVSSIEPINETYTLRNDSPTNKSNYNVSLTSDNAKNALSDTYIIENNINDTFSQQNSSSKSTNKSANVLNDMSYINNQPKSSLCNPNFIRKRPLDEVSQNFTLTNDDFDTTDNNEMNNTKNIESNKFKLKKTFHEADSQIFDNIISTSSQEIELSSYESTNHLKNNLSNTLMVSTEVSNNDLLNSLPESKSEKDMDVITDKSLTQQSNVVLDANTENDFNISKSLLLKYNTPSSSRRISGKFNFSRQFGRHSLSFQEKSDNCYKVKQHSISFNTGRNNSNMSNSFCNPTCNMDVGVSSGICTISENDSHTKEPNVSPSPVLKSASCNVENNVHESTLSQNNTSQSKLHFAGTHNLNPHSGVFSDLIDDSVNSDVSLDEYKQVKFKTRKNVSDEADSAVFENIIQESNTTVMPNKTLSQSILCDQSKMQHDEISIFANTDELWSNKKTPRSVDYSLKKLNTGKNLNLEESSFKDKLSVDTSNNSTLKCTANESIKENVSVMSVVENKTYCEQNDLSSTDKPININSSTITAGLLGSNSHTFRQTRSISKSKLSPNNTNLPSSSYKTLDDSSNFELDATKITSDNEMAHVSKHSMYITKDDEKSALINSSFESLKSNRSQKNRLKRSFSSKDSSTSGSNNEGLTLFNTTLDSLDNDESQRNRSKRSLTTRNSKTLTFKPSTSLNSSTESLKDHDTSNNLSESSVSSTHSAISIVSNNELSFNSSVKSSSQSSLNDSSLNVTDTKDISNVSNTSLKPEDSTNISKVTTSVSKQKNVSLEVSISHHGLPESSGLSLNTTLESSDKKLLLTNQSEKSNLFELETTNISRKSTRSSKQKDNSYSTYNISPEVSNIKQKLFENEGSITEPKDSVTDLLKDKSNAVTGKSFVSKQIHSNNYVETEVSNINHNKSSENKGSLKVNNTSAFSGQKKSLNNSKQSNSVVLEDETKNYFNDSRISTRSSRRINRSIKNIELEVSSSSHELPENKESFKLKNTSLLLEQKNPPLNKSKQFTSNIPEDGTKNNSKNSSISTRSSKRLNHSVNNIDLEVSNINHGISENEKSLKDMSASLKQKDLPLNRSQKSTENKTKNDSYDSNISNRSSSRLNRSVKSVEPEVFDINHGLSENEKSLKKTSAFLKQKDLQLNQSQKSTFENKTKNVSFGTKIATRSSSRINYSDKNLEPVVSNINDEPSENEESLKNTSPFLKQKDLPLNQPQESTSENKTKNKCNDSSISTRSSKQIIHSVKDIEPEVLNISHARSENKNSLKLQNALFSEQKKSPLNILVQSSTVVFENETEIDNHDIISTCSTGGIDHSSTNIEPSTLNTTHVLSKNEKSAKKDTAFLKETESSFVESLKFASSWSNDPIMVDRSSTGYNHFNDSKKTKVSTILKVDEPEDLSLNQHKRHNHFVLEEDKTNNASGISTQSSKHKKITFREFEPEKPIVAVALNLKKNKTSLNNSSRVTRSSTSSDSINDSSSPTIIQNKLSTSNINNISDNSVRHPINLAYFNNDNVVDETLSTHFSRSSKSDFISNLSNVSVNNDTKFAQTLDTSSSRNIVDLSNGNNDNVTDDSVNWTTLSESSTCKSTIQTSKRVKKSQRSCREKDFQTPTTNKLAITERIANTIGIMSENRHKVTHPGAFELVDSINAPLTRSLTRRPSTQSPSILSRVLMGHDKSNDFEDMSLSQTFSDPIIEKAINEVTIKEKYMTLYNKESWITKHLYKFLVSKLKPKYHIYAVKHAEKFVKYLASTLNQVYNGKVDLQLYSDMLRYHMARYEIVKDTFDYVEFLTDFIPRPFYDKLIPGWDFEASEVKFDPLKYYVPIMEDEEFLREVLENLNKSI